MNRHLLAGPAAAIFLVPCAAMAVDSGAMNSGGPPAATPAPEAAPSSAPAPGSLAPHGDIADTLKASGQFTVLSKALDQTNLTSVLKGAGPFTVIAPTDAAFQTLPSGTLDNLLKPENAGQLQSLLTYHVINAAVPLSKIQGAKGPVQTVNGAKVEIDGSASPIKFNDAEVTATATTTNGNIYVVDKVLSPNPAAASLDQSVAPPGAAAASNPAVAAQDQAAGPTGAPAAPIEAPAAASDAGAPASATIPADNGAPAAQSAAPAATVASAPIPDTAANRAKYGEPLSRTGRATQAAGN